jgi:hypothetical protein
LSAVYLHIVQLTLTLEITFNSLRGH